MTNDHSPYSDFIRRNAARVLSAADPDPDSPTFGCFDKNYWHYSLQDLPSALLQQGMLAAALLSTKDFPGNRWYKNERVSSIAEAGLDYTASIQNRDGSFSEFFPAERSVVATAFTLFAAVRSCRLLGLPISRYEGMLRKAAEFLGRRSAEDASNQEAASSLAVYETAHLLDSGILLRSAHDKIGRLLTRQSASGFFPEYGGADIGYSSVSLDMLCELYTLSRNADVLSAAERLLTAVSAFIHPDGSCGGVYGSRDTGYFLPFGIEFLAKQGNPRAAAIRQLLFSPTAGLRSVHDAFDDRYLCHYVLHSFIRACLLYTDSGKTVRSAFPYSGGTAYSLRCRSPGETYFRQEGLLSVSTNKYYFVAAGAKGGVCTIFSGTRPFYTDCGYRIRIKNRLFTTFFQSTESRWEKTGNTFRCTTYLQKMSGLRMSALRRFLLYAAARISPVMTGRRLKSLLIKQKEEKKIRFTRTIVFSEDRIELLDIIAAPRIIQAVYPSPPYTPRRVPSTRFDAYDKRPEGLKQANALPGRFPGGFKNFRIETLIDLKKGTIKRQTQ